jgi:ubiquitin
MNAIIEEIEADGEGASSMSSQTKEAADYKLNIFWREVVLSDGAPVSQHFPTPEEIQHRACKTHLSQGATDGCDLDDRLQAERDLRQAKDSAWSGFYFDLAL